MSSSAESAMPVIMQWIINGTGLKLHLTWDGIGIEVSNLRLEPSAAPLEGFILRNSLRDFSMTFKRAGITAEELPGTVNRCIRVTTADEASFLLCES
jgi:hypothetical protein